MSFFSSVEFYVIMAVVAAAIVAMASKPKPRRERLEYLVASTLRRGDFQVQEPEVEIEIRDNCDALLIRRGLSDVFMSGAVSLSIQFDGSDVIIEERLVQGSTWDEEANEAVFHLDFLTFGRYNVRYNSQKTGLFAAFSLHVRPGIVSTHKLAQ